METPEEFVQFVKVNDVVPVSLFLTYCFRVSIVDFEQVNASCDIAPLRIADHGIFPCCISFV